MCCRLVKLSLLLAALLPVGLAGPAGAQVTLSVALSKVYEENPTLEAARARLRTVDEGLPIARATRRPRASASSSVSFGRTETNQRAQNLRTMRNALGVEQPLFTGGEARARIERAEELIRAERARLELAEQAVFLDAIEAFTAVLRDQRVLELALANESRLLTQLNGVQRRFRFGELTQTDVAQAESRYARGIADREAALGRLEIAGAAFRNVIGEPPGTLVAPDLPSGLPDSVAEVLAAVDGHPAVRAATFAVAAADADIDTALAALKPRLTLRGDAGYVDDPGGEADWQSDVSVGAVLTVPLYQGGGEYARIRQSRQALTEERFNLQAARRDVEEESGSAWQSLVTARARQESLARQVEAAALALDGVQQEARVGTRTVLDVLDAEQELFEADVAITTAERDVVVAGYRVLAGMGMLTAGALDLDTVLFDPEAYYREVRGAWFGTGGTAGDGVADDAEGESRDLSAGAGDGG
jgi:TolC family type I secretion outer membrane protein